MAILRNSKILSEGEIANTWYQGRMWGECLKSLLKESPKHLTPLFQPWVRCSKGRLLSPLQAPPPALPPFPPHLC